MKPRNALVVGTCAMLGLILSGSAFATPMNDTAKALALGHKADDAADLSERVSRKGRSRADRVTASGSAASSCASSRERRAALVSVKERTA